MATNPPTGATPTQQLRSSITYHNSAHIAKYGSPPDVGWLRQAIDPYLVPVANRPINPRSRLGSPLDLQLQSVLKLLGNLTGASVHQPTAALQVAVDALIYSDAAGTGKSLVIWIVLVAIKKLFRFPILGNLSGLAVLVVPGNVVHQWMDELKKYILPGALSVHVLTDSSTAALDVCDKAGPIDVIIVSERIFINTKYAHVPIWLAKKNPKLLVIDEAHGLGKDARLGEVVDDFMRHCLPTRPKRLAVTANTGWDDASPGQRNATIDRYRRHLNLAADEDIASRIIMNDTHLYASYMPVVVETSAGGRVLQIRTAAELQPYIDAIALADEGQRDDALRAEMLSTWTSLLKDTIEGAPPNSRFVIRTLTVDEQIKAAAVLDAATPPIIHNVRPGKVNHKDLTADAADLRVQAFFTPQSYIRAVDTLADIPNLVVLDLAHSSWANLNNRNQGVARQKRLSSTHPRLLLHQPQYHTDHPLYTVDGSPPTSQSIIAKTKVLAARISGADNATAMASPTPRGSRASQPVRAKRKRGKQKSKASAAGGDFGGKMAKMAPAPARVEPVAKTAHFCADHGRAGGQRNCCTVCGEQIN